MGRYDGTMVGIHRRRFGSDDGVAVMGGASRRMRQGVDYAIPLKSYNPLFRMVVIYFRMVFLLYGISLSVNLRFSEY